MEILSAPATELKNIKKIMWPERGKKESFQAVYVGG